MEIDSHDAAVASIQEKLQGIRGEEPPAPLLSPDDEPDEPGVDDPEASVDTDPDPDDTTDAGQTDEERAEAEAAADAAEAALPDDATDEEREAARAAAEEEFYVGRYKTREEAERAIEEKDRTTKVALQRAAEAERKLQEIEAERSQQQEQLDVASWESWAQEEVARGASHDGALQAIQSGGYEGYKIYLRHWMRATDEDGNPDVEQISAAQEFNNELMLKMAEASARRVVEPAPEQRDAVESQKAADAIKEKYPDFDEVAPAIDDVLADLDDETRQWLVHERLEGGVAGKTRVLDYLYLQARLRKGESKTAARVAERQQRRASADAAKVKATVASSEGSASRTPRSAAEEKAIEIKNARRKHWGLPPVGED